LLNFPGNGEKEERTKKALTPEKKRHYTVSQSKKHPARARKVETANIKERRNSNTLGK